MEDVIKEKGNKKKRNMIIAVSLIVIIMVLCVYLYSNLIDTMSLFEKKEVDAFVIVANDSGLALNGTALMFGMLAPGGSSKKTVDLENTHAGLARVKIYSKGNITRFLNISDNNFLLYPNQTKTVIFRAKIPKGTALGNYSGKVVFEIRNAVVK